MRLESWARSDVGLVRKSNEDYVGCFPELGLFVVCDGLGGHAAGEVASRLAVEVIRDAVAGERPAPAPAGLLARTRRLLSRSSARSGEEVLRQAVEEANRRVWAAADGEAERERSMATTVVALAVDLPASRLAWAHVGDSRLYLLRRGVLELLTADHTVAGSRYLDGSEIPADLPHSNRLLQALGVSPTVDVVTRGGAAAAGDVLLLCSDGLSSLVASESIREALVRSPSLQDAGQSLIQRALDAGGNDNTSVVVVRLVAE
jgi:protein phosphatase